MAWQHQHQPIDLTDAFTRLPVLLQRLVGAGVTGAAAQETAVIANELNRLGSPQPGFGHLCLEGRIDQAIARTRGGAQ